LELKGLAQSVQSHNEEVAMTRRKWIFVGLLSVAVIAALATGAAYAVRGWFAPGRLFERMRAELKLTPEQARKADALRDRVMAHFRANKGDREALFAEGRALWLADQIDEAKLGALAAKVAERRAQAQKFILGVIREAHGILTREQRQKLVDLIESFRSRMKGHFRQHPLRP
jgi:Spy/CpxP family protein refolding chaperone